MVPSSGMVTWKSASTSSISASASTSTRSTSSMSSTTGSSARMAASSGLRQQERLREDVLLELGPALAPLVSLDAQQLLAIVPLVQRLGLVEALVALQADEPGAGDGRHGACQLRLADPGRPFHQHRLLEPFGEEDGQADAGVGQVVDLAQTVDDAFRGFETGAHADSVMAGSGGGAGPPMTSRRSMPNRLMLRRLLMAPQMPCGARTAMAMATLPRMMR